MQPLDSTQAPVQPRPAGCLVPVTAVQLREWTKMVRRGTELSDMRIVASSTRVLGPLDTCLLESCMEALIERHESLRTRIVLVDGNPTQHVDPNCGPQFEVIDLAAAPAATREQQARCIAQEFIHESIDLSVGPLFAARLFKLSSREHVLIMALDHMVTDGTSNAILSRELWMLYKQASQGRPFSLPPLYVQFADYAVWQQRTHDAWLREHGAYWRARLDAVPRVQLPTGARSPEGALPAFAMMQFVLGKALSIGLRDMAHRQRTSLWSVVLAFYVVVMSRWCDQEDLLVTFISHGRSHRPELANMVGYLANFLHLRIRVRNGESILDLLKQVDLELRTAHQHQDHSRVLDPTAEDISELYFNWVPTSWVPTDWSRGSVHHKQRTEGPLELLPFPIELAPRRTDASFKFMLAPSDSAMGIALAFIYRSDLLSPAAIEQLWDMFRRFAAELSARPLAPIGSVALE